LGVFVVLGYLTDQEGIRVLTRRMYTGLLSASSFWPEIGLCSHYRFFFSRAFLRYHFQRLVLYMDWVSFGIAARFRSFFSTSLGNRTRRCRGVALHMQWDRKSAVCTFRALSLSLFLSNRHWANRLDKLGY